ncbi:unnamed protein product [Ilex paraguariensis]|uniref:BHLH domain-containing protein n=1 Tax=Ilex paraguariensis TaxID=185542 RepID=A0ABC8RWT6_9AQUA
MVCQAASQTRFRALKHENGIAGCATIIVRVIACFQPLQDCQAEYFRHLLKPHYDYCSLGSCCGWMAEDFGSWFHHQHSDQKSPNLGNFTFPFNLGQQRTVPAYMYPCGGNMVAANGTYPLSVFTGLPNYKACQPNEPRGWFYCLPRFGQAFAPAPNSVLKEKLLANPHEICKEAGAPDVGPGCPEKRFLVFDQSGDQTTLIFNSGIVSPAQCMTSWNPKAPAAYELNTDPGAKKDAAYHYGAFLTDEYEEGNHTDDVGSELREDTGELDALLDSDDDDYYSEDDEETSTGHSPSTMTGYDKQELSEESGEEVASSAGPAKRQKLLHGEYGVPSLMDTASSLKRNRCFEDENDAESRCGDGNYQYQVLGNMDSSSGNKRSRREKIRETISILQTIIPGEKGKDAIMVIDEAINHLRSLKHNAKALGLDTL